MYLLDYSLDNLSLMALTLSVGFVVDDAIVMLENIVRHMEMGKAPMRAALDGSKEIAFTIISMTLSLAAVFIPVLFMGGIVGRLLHEFAVTIGVAILVSGFVSISLTPMLCSRFLKPPHAQKHGWFYNAIERMFDAWLRLYDWTLRVSAALPRRHDGDLDRAARRHRCTCSRSSRRASCRAKIRAASTSAPKAIQGIGFDEMVRHQHAGRRRSSRRIPNIAGMQQQRRRRTGGGGLNTGRHQRRPQAARRAQARRSIRSIAELRPKLAQVPGVRVFMINQPPINLGGQQGARSLYQFTLQDTDTAELYHWAPILEAEDARDARPRGRQQRSADQEPAGHGRRWTATRSRRSA